MEALEAVWSLSHARVLKRLRGEYVPEFDNRGLHPASVEFGRLFALGELMGTSGDLDPVLLKREARESAVAQFREEIRQAVIEELDREETHA